MSRSKCYIVWEDGERVCRINHRDQKNCDLYERTNSGYQSSCGTWRYRPLVTKSQVDKVKKKATRLQRLMLLFRRSKYSFDISDEGTYRVRYKLMGDVVYIMKRGTGFIGKK